MEKNGLHVVTGAFGFSGRYIAKRLLEAGCRVRTLTNSPGRANPFGGKIAAFPYDFERPERLAGHLRGATVLYNSYWVRFGGQQKGDAHAEAVKNTKILFDAALKAGIKRIVHISITNPSENSPFGYFRGKAQVEQMLTESGLGYAILRPAVLFGREDILINNIAWILRRFPVFGIFGKGDYCLRPIYVDDLARLAVEQGQKEKAENVIIDAVGPETFTYWELAGMIGAGIGRPRPMISMPPLAGYILGWFISKMHSDVTIGREEIGGLMSNLLCTGSPASGSTRLSEWVSANRAVLGMHYRSELARRRNREKAYEEL